VSSHDELVATLALLNAVASESLDRGDWLSAIDAAAAAWSESFVYAWERLDPQRDHVCPRCFGELVFSASALQWTCDFCFRRVLEVLAGRRS
jgi:hypothetical protein